MRRDQLEHAIWTACQIIQQPEVIVVGSQAILGTYDESQLPAAATMSIEVDILPIADTNDEVARLADLIEGAAGELFSIRGAAWFQHRRRRPHDRGTAPRLARSAGQDSERQHGSPRRRATVQRPLPRQGDLCVAKLVAFREKDRNFVAALLEANLVDADLIAARLSTVPPEHAGAVEQARTWLGSTSWPAVPGSCPGWSRSTDPAVSPTSQ